MAEAETEAHFRLVPPTLCPSAYQSGARRQTANGPPPLPAAGAESDSGQQHGVLPVHSNQKAGAKRPFGPGSNEINAPAGIEGKTTIPNGLSSFSLILVACSNGKYVKAAKGN